jgi:hypothetical protein
MTATASPPPWPRRSSGPSRPPSPVRTKRGIDEVLAFFAALDSVGFKAKTFFLQAGDDYVVDLHRGYFMAETARSTRPGRSPADANCCQPLLLDPDAMIRIDLHKRRSCWSPDEENSPRLFLTMDALYRLS